jgi:hypothetical protein
VGGNVDSVDGSRASARSMERWSNFLGNQYITRVLTRFQQVDVITPADINDMKNQTSNNPLNSLTTIYRVIK